MFLLQASTTALFDTADLKLIAPEIVLSICACVALVLEVLLPYRQRRWVGYFALGATALAAASVCVLGWPLVSGFLHEVPLVGRAVSAAESRKMSLKATANPSTLIDP